MDKTSVSGTENAGSIPARRTKKTNQSTETPLSVLFLLQKTVQTNLKQLSHGPAQKVNDKLSPNYIR